MGKINLKVLISCLVIVYAVALIGSLFTSSSVSSSWYESIKPAITPPNWVFPIVWNILFFLIAISLYLVWTFSNKKDKGKIIIVYTINFILNVFWSILYFGLKNPAIAFYEIIFLFSSIIAMILINYRINKTAFYLLIPYLLWVGFAGVLNWLSAF